MENEILQSLKASANYKNAALSQAATLTIISSVAGVLHTVNIGSSSCPTLTLYDNASGASGTILALIEPGTRQNYIYDTSFLVGVTAWLTGGNSPSANISFR